MELDGTSGDVKRREAMVNATLLIQRCRSGTLFLAERGAVKALCASAAIIPLVVIYRYNKIAGCPRSRICDLGNHDPSPAAFCRIYPPSAQNKCMNDDQSRGALLTTVHSSLTTERVPLPLQL